MSDEHPFASFIRILGKGPKLSRSLTEEEACAATRLLLAGAVEPAQVGAFLCLLRVKTETPAEIAGIVSAARESLALPPEIRGAVELDWPAYADKPRRPPWFLLAARLLARNGVRVLLHGDSEGGIDAHLAAAGIPRVAAAREIDANLRAHAVAYLPLAAMQSRLSELLRLRRLLGVRSPINTALRQLNPLAAGHQLIGVAHPHYRDLQRDTASLLAQPHAAVFKGEGGAAERRPEKPCLVQFVECGAAHEMEFPALLATASRDEAPLDPRRIAAAWDGSDDDPLARASIVGTTAIALRLLQRADSPAAADALAARWWRARHEDASAAA